MKNSGLFRFILIATLLNGGLLNAQKNYGGYYTEERINNLRENSKTYEWAKELKKSAIERASLWVAKNDEELWAMIPGQDLPRCIDVTMDRLGSGSKKLGCLNCGDDIHEYGNYPYEPDIEDKPWKLTCPSCQVVFPTNDFGAYYRSAIDEHGLFDPAKGDRSLLYNTNHPDPEDPLHKYGVDDGFGYIDNNGQAHRFIGYYTWKYWRHINEGLKALSDAFLYTGEKKYAHKAAILLDRIADVYPDMDWEPYAKMGWYHSDGGRYQGKIEGSIWETVVVQVFADSYDKILSGTIDSPELFTFLQEQSKKYEVPTAKGTRRQFIKNVDDRILRTAFEAVKSGQIRGNQGLHQLSVAMCALALNSEPETTEWLDWLFEPDGGAIPGLMVDHLDRDGMTNEGAPGYALMWGRLVTQLATVIASYPSYTTHDIFDDYPQFRATFLAAYRLAALGKAIPNLGDSGATGLVSRQYADPQFMAQGFNFTRDTSIAVAAYRANGNSAEGLGRNIFSKDPNALSHQIKAIAEDAGPRPEGGYLMSGFGLALLENGTGDNGIALAGNYGRSIMHAHPDILNFDIFAFGNWLAPDHGYPEYATKWPSNIEWTGSTLSHNTVYVNEQPQNETWGGYTRLFKQLKGFGVFEADGHKAYPELEEYSRTMFLIGDDENEINSDDYIVDIFRVQGGNDHVYSFHGPPGKMKQDGLELITQQKGTYAGEDIPKGTWAKGFPIGYSHLYNIRRDKNPPSNFIVDWKAKDNYREASGNEDIHLRFHALIPSMDVTLADGDPPQNKPGNPKQLGYMLMHRAGVNLNSTFISVIEPYKKKPFIKSVRTVNDNNDETVALEVEKVDGTIDYILYNSLPENKIHLPNGISMHGKVGLIRKRGNKVTKGILVNGTALSYKNMNLKDQGVIKGKVVKMNKEIAGGGWLIVDKKLPTDGSLEGQQIIIEPIGERDASYTIQEVEQFGDHSKIYCGPITFVSGYKGENIAASSYSVPKSYEEGYNYDFEEGASFKIITHKVWRY